MDYFGRNAWLTVSRAQLVFAGTAVPLILGPSSWGFGIFPPFNAINVLSLPVSPIEGFYEGGAVPSWSLMGR